VVERCSREELMGINTRGTMDKKCSLFQNPSQLLNKECLQCCVQYHDHQALSTKRTKSERLESQRRFKLLK
jgi:hypothetical protein